MRSHLENTAISGVIPSFLHSSSDFHCPHQWWQSAAHLQQLHREIRDIPTRECERLNLLETGVWLRISFFKSSVSRQGISWGKTFGQYLGFWVPSSAVIHVCITELNFLCDALRCTNTCVRKGLTVSPFVDTNCTEGAGFATWCVLSSYILLCARCTGHEMKDCF